MSEEAFAAAAVEHTLPGDRFRHPDTPKRAGPGGDAWRRATTSSSSSSSSSAPSTSCGGGSPAARGGSPTMREAAARRLRATTPCTPRGMAGPRLPHNPFECDDMMTSLSMPTSSPSLFENVTSPNDKEEPGWAIEQMAELHPANIEVDPFHQQLLCQKYDPQIEMQVQTAIDRFFNSEKIVPSPWSADGPRRTVQVTGCRPDDSPLVARAAASSSAAPDRHDQASQTALTLPTELPAELERLLAPYLCGADTVPEDRSQLMRDDDDSMLSNSTLRRKLLFHGVEPASNDVSMTDADASVYHFPDSPDKGHLQPSSPPSARRHASLPRPGAIESPPVSPICKSMLASPSTSSIQSQGLAKIRYPSSDLSDPGDADSDRESALEAEHSRLHHPDAAAAAVEDGSGREELVSYSDDTAPQDTGYHSTLASLPSLSARHLAAAAGCSASGSLLTSTRVEAGSILASTRLEPEEAAAPTTPAVVVVGAGRPTPQLEATLEQLQDGSGPRPPVPIGSSTPSRSQAR